MGLVALGAAIAATPSVALAGHAPRENDPLAFHAGYERQSPNLTLESGQEAESWFEARNRSAGVTWDNGFVKLGTDEPHDRPSAMFWDADWLSPHRPTFMNQRVVGPNGVARFTYRVKAPTVNATTTYREYLAPVAEGYAWMDADDWGQRFIDYVVTPPSPPSVSLASAPVRIRRGDALNVTARARDDYKLSSLTFTVGGSTVNGTVADPAAAPDTYAGSLPTTELRGGFHTLSVKGTDHVGNEQTITHQFEVFEEAGPPPPPFVPPPKLDASVTLKVRLVRGGRRGVKVLGLSVKAPVGSRLSISCKPRRCRNQVIGATKRSITRPGRTKGRTLRRGTRVYVRVTKPGMIGELTRFTVGRRSVARAEYAIPAR